MNIEDLQNMVARQQESLRKAIYNLQKKESEIDFKIRALRERNVEIQIFLSLIKSKYHLD